MSARLEDRTVARVRERDAGIESDVAAGEHPGADVGEQVHAADVDGRMHDPARRGARRPRPRPSTDREAPRATSSLPVCGRRDRLTVKLQSSPAMR